MSPRFRSAFAAPTGFVAAVTPAKPNGVTANQPAPDAQATQTPRDSRANARRLAA